MSAQAWKDLERITKGASTPTAPKKSTDAPSQGTPGGSRQKKTVSAGPGRSAPERDRSPKRQRRTEPESGVVFELDNVGPQQYEDFKKAPLLMCSEICRSADEVFRKLKIESTSAMKERDAALKRLTELEPQVQALKEKDRQLEDVRKAAEKEKKQADEERARMSKKIKDLMSQNRNLHDQNKNLQVQVARAEEEKDTAVAVEMKRIAELAKGAAIHQFNNAVSQMQAFNAARGAQYDEKIIKVDHVVEDGEIVLPQELDDEGKVVRPRTVIFGRPQ